MSENIFQVPDAPNGYDLTGKKIMVHDLSQPEVTSTVKIDIGVLGIPGDDIEFVVGESESPADGTTTTQHNTTIGKRVRLFRDSKKQTKIDIPGGYKFSHNPITGIITYSPALQEGEMIQIEIY